MQRPRLFATLSALAATVVAVPVLATVALAADPIVTVRSGDTLTAISKRHDVPIERLVELNRVADPNRIRVGQRLRLEPEASAPAARAAAPAAQLSRTHTVGRGENLTTIARHYGVTVASIAAANAIANPSRIYSGQTLTIPGAAASTAAAPTTRVAPAVPVGDRVHTVRRGDNLTTIAREYGITVSAIVRANAITNPGRIFGGQRLTIPGGTVPTSAPTASQRIPGSMAELVAQRDGVRRIIVAEAERFGVPAAFALAVAWQESGWQQGVVSNAGAVGVMQLLPASGEWVGEVMLRTHVNIHDTKHNIQAGVRLLAHYLDRYDGDRDQVLAAYYQGQTAVDRHGIYAVSRPYIASIKALTRIFGG